MSDSILNNTIFTESPGQTLYDYSIAGGFDVNGQVTKVYNDEALNQAIGIWLRLKQGEMLYKPTLGGYTYSFVTKSLSEEGRLALKEFLIIGIENDFTPKLNILQLSVEINDADKAYDIFLNVQTKDLKIQAEFKDSFKVVA